MIMMKSLTCIVCPIGCALTVEEGAADLPVTGNRCPRGAAYAREEIRAPKRVVTATCRIAGKTGPHTGEAPDAFSGLKRAPVKSSVPCPKERIPELLADIYRTQVTLPVKSGDTVIANWQGTGIDIVAVRQVG
jgi:CxxC motif-containing protein